MTTNSPLRIVHVTFGLDVGGLEKLLLEFARYVDPIRNQLVFVSLGANGAVGDELLQIGWSVYCLNKREGFRPGLAAQLARIYRDVRADVVHTHDAQALIYGAPAARLARVRKVFHTQHGQGIGLSRRQTWLVRTAARALTRYICVSHDARRIAEESFGIAREKLCTIFNGIGVERFASQASQDTRDRGPLTVVARLSPEKGIDTLIHAAALALPNLPDLRVEIAGDGPCRDSLHRLRDELGLRDQVNFLGQVHDIPGLLRRSRLFVLPSNSEGVSLTLLEAMASRIPVIATQVGGSGEVVTHGRTGLLTPAGDARAMAQAIARLWSDREERAQFAEAGYRRVCEAFHVEHMVEHYECLYHGTPLPGDVQAPRQVDPASPVKT